MCYVRHMYMLCIYVNSVLGYGVSLISGLIDSLNQSESQTPFRISTYIVQVQTLSTKWYSQGSILDCCMKTIYIHTYLYIIHTSYF